MTKPQVKICGITNLIDAKNALALGADYIGFISINSSPRFITIDQIAEIGLSLSEEEKAKCVLVTNENIIDQIVSDCSYLGFKYVQPYGDHQLKDLRSLSLFELNILKPLGVKTVEDLKDIGTYSDFIRLLILDTKTSEQLGGTGKCFDWDIFGEARSLTDSKLGLAGGLNPENINEAIAKTGADLLDLSSGLESKPGVKSFDKMKQLFSALN